MLQLDIQYNTCYANVEYNYRQQACLAGHGALHHAMAKGHYRRFHSLKRVVRVAITCNQNQSSPVVLIVDQI